MALRLSRNRNDAEKTLMIVESLDNHASNERLGNPPVCLFLDYSTRDFLLNTVTRISF